MKKYLLEIVKWFSYNPAELELHFEVMLHSLNRATNQTVKETWIGWKI
jgi:hypothetical protein